MVRTIITPQQTDIHLSVPEEYIGKQVEVLVYSVEELIQEPLKKQTMAEFWGTMSNETAQDLQEQVKLSRQEWDHSI